MPPLDIVRFGHQDRQAVLRDGGFDRFTHVVFELARIERVVGPDREDREEGILRRQLAVQRVVVVLVGRVDPGRGQERRGGY